MALKHTLRLTSFSQIQFEVTMSTKLLGCYHRQKAPFNQCLTKDDNNPCDRNAVGILNEPDVIVRHILVELSSHLELRSRRRRSHL